VPKEVSLAEAKATLSECIRAVERGDPVVITRHGRRVAAIVPAEDLDQFLRLRSVGPNKGLASLAGTLENPEEFLKNLESHKRSKPRNIPKLE
jgi:prevent-host-death family protein